jgi:RNA polymerase sigma-70 factor (ECF subfamily)
LRYAENTAEDDIVHSELMESVRKLIDELPEEQQEVVRLRYYSKLSFQEIAEQTDVSINTALGRMRYALINLRRMIKEKNIILN